MERGIRSDFHMKAWRYRIKSGMSILLSNGVSWMGGLVMLSTLAILIAWFMGPTWGPSGADKTQVGSMLAPWTLLSGFITMCLKVILGPYQRLILFSMISNCFCGYSVVFVWESLCRTIENFLSLLVTILIHKAVKDAKFQSGLVVVQPHLAFTPLECSKVWNNWSSNPFAEILKSLDI